MIRGLIDGITDPDVQARVAERARIVGRLAEQMGVSKDEARDALWSFEACTSSEGHTLH